jgi:flagellar hook assembly protein FlgD
LDGIQIFPNPLRPAIGHKLMIFSNLPANTRLRIYTLAGELVNELNTGVSGTTSWDGTNQSGQKAASGVYYVYVQGAGDSKTLKVAVQR